MGWQAAFMMERGIPMPQPAIYLMKGVGSFQNEILKRRIG
jgi:hypothetical protein